MAFRRELKPEPTEIFRTPLSYLQNLSKIGIDSRSLAIGRPLIDLIQVNNNEVGTRALLKG